MYVCDSLIKEWKIHETFKVRCAHRADWIRMKITMDFKIQARLTVWYTIGAERPETFDPNSPVRAS